MRTGAGSAPSVERNRTQRSLTPRGSGIMVRARTCAILDAVSAPKPIPYTAPGGTSCRSGFLPFFSPPALTSAPPPRSEKSPTKGRMWRPVRGRGYWRCQTPSALGWWLGRNESPQRRMAMKSSTERTGRLFTAPGLLLCIDELWTVMQLSCKADFSAALSAGAILLGFKGQRNWAAAKWISGTEIRAQI